MPVLNHPDGSPISQVNPLPISGNLVVSSAIALDQATLDALETTTLANNVLTDTQLRATPVDVDTGLVQPLTNTELRALSVATTVGNFPTSQAVTGTVELGTSTLTALENTTVSVSNFPATQPISGTVSIGNSPSVSVSNFPATQSVNVGNFPSTQAISGSVSISNSPSVAITNFPITQPVSGSVGITGAVSVVQSGAGTAVGTPLFEAIVSNGSVVSTTNPLPVALSASDLGVHGVGAAATAVTITLPAAGASLFHYIDAIEIMLFSTAARTGSATPVSVTSTNLRGYGLTFASAGLIGSVDRYNLSSDRPMKSAVANTASTISLPAVTGALWRYNVIYSAGA